MGTGGAGRALEPLGEVFWAKENMAGEIEATSTPAPKADYDANSFNDDNMDRPVEVGDDDDDDALQTCAKRSLPAEDGGAASEGALIPVPGYPDDQ